MSFNDLKSKEVINVLDGKRLGKVIDLYICERTASVEAIVVPGQMSVWNMIRGIEEGVVIPWQAIKRLGDDVILVEIDCATIVP